MTHALGVISASANDWSHTQVLPVFSASAVVLGLTTATLGSWVEQVGPRHAGFVGSILWSTALITTAAGVHFHSLPLVYAGWYAPERNETKRKISTSSLISLA